MTDSIFVIRIILCPNRYSHTVTFHIAVVGRRRAHVDAWPLQTAAGDGGDRQRAGRAEGDLGGRRQEGDGGEGGDHLED